VDHGQAPTPHYDLGHAAHKLVLGVGEPIIPVDADDWRTKAAKEMRDKAHANGDIPLLRADYDTVHAMAAALRRHPVAGPLFTPGTGLPEQSLFWQDPDFGVWRRCRLDWLRHRADDTRLIIPDYKTCYAADPEAAAKAMANYCYHQQGAWYVDGAIACGLAGDIEPAFLLVFQEKTPPYLVGTYQVHLTALAAGRVRNRKALDIYRTCSAAGRWPGYGGDDIAVLELPGWATYQHNAALEAGDYDTSEDAA
jgi:hypothetical protein